MLGARPPGPLCPSSQLPLLFSLSPYAPSPASHPSLSPLPSSSLPPPLPTSQFPEKGSVFDYYVDEAQCVMAPWEDKVAKFTYTPDDFSGMFVNTVETTRLTYFLDSLVKNKHHVMFVGNTGTGKSAIMLNKVSIGTLPQRTASTASCTR